MDRQIALEIWDTWKNRKSIKGFIQKVFTINEGNFSEIAIDSMDGESYVTVDDKITKDCMTLYIKSVGFYNNSLLVSLEHSNVSLIFNI